MPRMIGDIPTEIEYPVPGSYKCLCVGCKRDKAKSGTDKLVLEWMKTDGKGFNDNIFITGKAVKRLILIAKRVCGIANDFSLPDDDQETAETLAVYIEQNIENKSALVTIEEIEESFMPTSGPDAGRMKKVKKRRVSFNGYEEIKDDKQPLVSDKELPI
jgi:hypothetical protein